jgi:hypothetical protein
MATMAEAFGVFLICYSKMQGQNFQTNYKFSLFLSSESTVHNYPLIKSS